MRALRPDEIEVRIGSISKNGVSFLLYKNARVDMAILDETYGEFGWQDRYEERKGVMYCSIGVKSPDGEWVWKEDCGTESFTEAQKGEASDAFKRAGFRWGIGRELYTSPRIFLNLKTKPKERGSGFELEDQWATAGMFVSAIRTTEENGKLVIKAVELSKKEFDKVYPVGVFPKGERI